MTSAAPSIESPGSPPTPASGWATGLGVVALVYAIAGILVNGLGLAFMGFSEQAAAAAATGPVQWGLGGLAILLGIVLVIGAVGLLRRRRWGVRMTTAWVVARLLLLLVAGVHGWLTLPQQVDAQMSMMEERLAEARSGDGSAGGSRSVRVRAGGDLDREAMLKWSKLAFVGGVAVTGTFPVVAGWILSNRRRREEIAAWSS